MISLLPPNLKLKMMFAGLILACFSSVNSLAQVEDILINTDSLDAQLETFNENKDELEQLIKNRECVFDVGNLRKQFLEEVAFIDSVIGAGDVLKLPELAKNNKLLIVAELMEGDKCVFIMYPKAKFVPGCEEPFFAASIDWTIYTHLNNAKKEGSVCLMDVQSSGYTQVEKIPGAELTQKSADMLLRQIERVLFLYNDVIKITFDQYLAVEKKRNYINLNDLILFRTSTLNECRNRIQSN